MADEQQPPQKKKTDSDRLRQASAVEYISAHSRPSSNGNGFKGFFHSNLFVALIMWLLAQGVMVGGAFAAFWLKTSKLAEWRGGVDATLKRMDEQGTVHGHYKDETEDKDISDLQARMKIVEQDTRHIEVLESEHRRLTKDVEELRNGPKK